MKIERRKIDNRVEQRIVTGMVVSGDILSGLERIYDPVLFNTPFARTVADWCYAYWKQYHSPPLHHIEDIYHVAKEAGNLREDMAEMIEEFLAECSEEYSRADKFNVPYVMDQALKYFKSQSLLRLSESIAGTLATGQVDEAEALLTGYKRIQKQEKAGVDPLTDTEAIYNAFENENKPLFLFPGALGRMLNKQLVRDALLGIMGAEKRGKSWWVIEMALQALKARCNVALFSVGDMSEHQILRRFHHRLARKPSDPDQCGEVIIPILDCVHNQDSSCESEWRKSPTGLNLPQNERDDETAPGDAGRRERRQSVDSPHEKLRQAPPGYKPCTVCLGKPDGNFRGACWYARKGVESHLTWREAVKNGKRLEKWTRGRHLKIMCYANSTQNIKGISDQLDLWEKFEGFVPDVVLIDYPDILAPEDARKEFRNQQNDTWKAMRGLSQTRHCLVIAPTQVNAASYDAKSLRMKNFSEDKRKYSHVTGMMTLNQTDEEKRLLMQRLGWLLLREGEFDPARQVTVLQCLTLGCIHVSSF